MDILLCTHGHPDTRPALEYGVWLAGTGPARGLFREVVLLGVVEKPARRAEVEALIQEMGRRLQEVAVPYRVVLREGKMEKVIVGEAHAERLTVVGPMGSRLAWARSLSQLLAAVKAPVLWVTETRRRLERVLLCTGGLRYAEGVIRTGGWLAQIVGAAVTLLHVVEPITLEYPVAKEVKSHWANLLETDTLQARRLQRALEILEGMGVAAKVRVRHGPVVHEILHEVREGDYDLVGVGSPYAARSLRRLYRPNVAVEIAEAAGRPVLIARAGPEDQGEP